MPEKTAESMFCRDHFDRHGDDEADSQSEAVTDKEMRQRRRQYHPHEQPPSGRAIIPACFKQRSLQTFYGSSGLHRDEEERRDRGRQQQVPIRSDRNRK